MKLRISDAIDCTCTTGGWSRELNPATQERKRGWGDWDGGMVDALPVKYGGKRQNERVNEWLPICSIPLLERLVPRVQIYPRFTPLPPFSWSPGHPCESYHCAHASHLSTMGGRFRFSLGSTISCLNTCRVWTSARISCLYSSIFAVFRFARISCTRISRYMYIVTVKSSNESKGSEFTEIYVIILAIKFLRAIIYPTPDYIILPSILLIFRLFIWIAYNWNLKCDM